MTPERKQELRKLCEAATPGPWNVEHKGCRKTYHHGCQLRCDNSKHVDGTIGWLLAKTSGGGPSTANIDFIAASRTALPELIDALEAATGEITHWTDRVDATTRENLRLSKDLDAAQATLESLRLIIAPNETLEDIVRATQRTIDTVFVEIEQANNVHAKNVDLSDKLRAANARADALAGQVAEMRETAIGWAEATVEMERICIPLAWDELRRVIRAKFLTQPPTATEAKVAAALALAEAVVTYKDARNNGPDNKTFDAAWRAAEAAEAAYRAAKEGGDV